MNVSERQSCDLIRIRNFAEKNISYKEQTNICWEHVLKMFVSHHSEIILNMFDKINVGSHWAVGRPNKERLIWQCKGKDKETLWERKSADNHYWLS